MPQVVSVVTACILLCGNPLIRVGIVDSVNGCACFACVSYPTANGIICIPMYSTILFQFGQKAGCIIGIALFRLSILTYGCQVAQTVVGIGMLSIRDFGCPYAEI